MSIYIHNEIDDVSAVFEQQVRARGGAAAILHNGEVITYQTLDERIALAARYHERSSHPPGVEVSHQPAAVEHLLGALQAGAAYCPIDVALPVARRQALARAFGAG